MAPSSLIGLSCYRSRSRMLRAAALAYALLGISALAVDVPFTTCGEDTLGLEKLSVSTYPIPVGGSVELKVLFAPKEQIETGAKLTLTLFKGAQQLFDTTVDMCSSTPDISCPLEAGKEVVLTQTQTVPAFVPKGVYRAHITAHDGQGEQISCIDADLEIVHALSEEELRTRPAVSSALLANIAMARPTWTAHWSPKFANATLAHAARLCGTRMRGHPNYVELPERTGLTVMEDLPTNFDAREQWPECKSVIGHIRDQSACGSCWAFATTEAVNDRLCIERGLKVLLSPTDTAACCTGYQCGFSQGCNGGQPSGAWSWFSETGVVTGGDQVDENTGSSCLPYPFPSCAHHVDPTPEHPACPDGDYDTPVCSKSCSDSAYTTSYRADKHMSKDAYSVKGESRIMQEIYERGSVTAALTVYEDFLVYEKGVYTHVSGQPLGGHAIKMIGWGVENGTPYWLCVNSWNDSWGSGGLFKILRGKNECGIESEVAAGSV